MKKIYIYIIICISSSQAIAGIINETNTSLDLGNGNYAELQGLTWLTLNETAGKSRDEIENGYKGLLADGWRYASLEQTSILFSSLWNGIYSGYDVSNSYGAHWFVDNFGQTDTYTDPYGAKEEYAFSRFFYGEDEGCNVSWMAGDNTCVASVGYSTDLKTATYYNRYNTITNQWEDNTYNPSQFEVGYIQVSLTLPYRTSIPKTYDYNNIAYSSLLVKTLEVPEPTSLALLGLGLAGFVFTRKKKKLKNKKLIGFNVRT